MDKGQKERQARYYSKNKEKIKARVLRWKKSNARKISVYNRNVRAKKRREKEEERIRDSFRSKADNEREIERLLSLLDEDNFKECSRCKVRKPLTAYYKRKGTPDGLQYLCRSCILDSNKARKDKCNI